MAAGESLVSSPFVIETRSATTRWRLKLYPTADGPAADSEDDTDDDVEYRRRRRVTKYTSLFLNYERENKYEAVASVSANVAFSFINKHGKAEKNYVFDTVFGTAKGQSMGFGYDKLISHVALNTPLLLPDDELRIQCRMTLRGEDVCTGGQSRASRRPTDTLPRLSADLASLLEPDNDNTFSDCVVECEGQEFRCHKSLLAARSPVFRAMFAHDMREQRRSRLEITDLGLETVRDLVQYLYTGRVDDLPDKAYPLLVAADKYDLDELKSLCEYHLGEDIGLETVFDTLVMAELQRAHSLKAQALRFIRAKGMRLAEAERAEVVNKLKNTPELMAEVFMALTKI